MDLVLLTATVGGFEGQRGYVYVERNGVKCVTTNAGLAFAYASEVVPVEDEIDREFYLDSIGG